jgi:hypothetical protein
MVTQTPSALWFGMGKGVFPRAYFRAQKKVGDKLARLTLLHEGDESFVRFSRSDNSGPVDLRQHFDIDGHGHSRSDNNGNGHSDSNSEGRILTLKLRVPHAQQERFLIEFCERCILKFLAQCKWRGVDIPAQTPVGNSSACQLHRRAGVWLRSGYSPALSKSRL